MKLATNVIRAFPLIILTSFAIAAGACSDTSGSDGDGDAGDGDGDGGDYLFCSPADTCPPSIDGVDMTTPRSFRTDVYEAYFRDSCGGGSGCHGKASTAAANLHLGSTEDPLDDTQITNLIAQLKGAPTEIAPTQMNVVPGDWQSSWLMASA